VTFWEKYFLISAEIAKNYDTWHLVPEIKPAEGAKEHKTSFLGPHGLVNAMLACGIRPIPSLTHIFIRPSVL